MPALLDSDRDPLAPLGPAGINDGPAGLGAHPFAKAVLVFPLQVAGLKGSLHR